MLELSSIITKLGMFLVQAIRVAWPRWCFGHISGRCWGARDAGERG